MDTPLPSHIASLDDITLQGREDYLRSPSRYQPPFSFGSDEYNAYEHGWMQAHKRSSLKGAVVHRKWEEGEVPSSPQPTSVAPEFNAYERRKG